VPSLPEPTDLRVELAVPAPGAHEPQTSPARPRVRALVDRWLAHGIGSRRRRGAKAKTAAPTLADIWNAWGVAEAECAIALRAWQLAPRLEKRQPYEAYSRALAREALVARELRLRAAR
jgi:hypothetical protein